MNNFHLDDTHDKTFKTVIYYINDSDGDTVIYNNKNVKLTIIPLQDLLIWGNKDLQINLAISLIILNLIIYGIILIKRNI